MFILGLTGSLAMGKSATAKMFVEEGVPVHDADAVVHRLYDGEATPAIEAAFPGTTQGGKVDRDKLGKRVLGDAKGAPVAVLDVPLLFETGGDARCDAVVVVSAPADVQRTRAFERPGMTEGKLAAILAKQMPDAQKRARADFVVDTSKGFDAARAQVRDILKAVAKMPKRRP